MPVPLSAPRPEFGEYTHGRRGDKHHKQMPGRPFSSQFETGCLIMKGHRPLGDVLVRRQSVVVDGGEG
jgi:hypothetical protein